MTENITIIDPKDGSEYNLIVSSEDAEKAQNDATFAEELLETARQHLSAEIHISGDYHPAKRWNRDAVEIMLEEYGKGGGRKVNWFRMSERISALGVYVSIHQCKGKMKSMKRTYLLLRDNNGCFSNNKKWPYYDAMKDLYNDKCQPGKDMDDINISLDPSYVLDESATMTTEVICEDMNEGWVGELDVRSMVKTEYEENFNEGPPAKRQKVLKTCVHGCNLCNERREMDRRHKRDKKQFHRDLVEVLKTFPKSKKKGKPTWQTFESAVDLLAPILDISSSEESDCCTPERELIQIQ